MTHFRKSVLAHGLLICCIASAQNTPPPRSAATAYAAYKVQPAYSIGAKQLSKTEVRNSFATPLAGRFIVVEVGFYPADNKTIDVTPSDFTLRTSDGKDESSPANPGTIASICQKQPQSGSDVTLYPTANVGYVSYPDYNGSGRRVSGPVFGVGTGVGVDKSPPAATTDSDRQTMETELLDKQLKDATVSRPVAGYLYFPITTRQKVEYQLQYHGTDAVTSLPLKVR